MKTQISRLIAVGFIALVAFYLSAGVVFHFVWKHELEACRAVRQARGEFVEPEMFGGVIGFVFDVTYWPTYMWANLYHSGTPFSTPCTPKRAS